MAEALSLQQRRAAVVHPIQYLRGLAAMLVVWHHGREQLPWVGAWFHYDFGTVGVAIFFVISGFIMVFSTHGREITPVEFAKRRLIRVAPLYWVLTLLLAGLALAAPSLFRSVQVTLPTLLQSLFFVPHMSLSHVGREWPLLVPGWTLNIEMFFYGLFALSLWLGPRWRIPALVGVLLALAAVGHVVAPSPNAFVRAYAHPLLLEFALGVLIGHAWLGGRLVIPWAGALAMFGLGGWLLLQGDTRWGPLAQALGAALVVVAGLTPRLLDWKSTVLRVLGDASYSIYLTHLFSLGALRWAWNKWVPPSPDVGMACLFLFQGLLLGALVGWLAYLWLERPLLAVCNRLWASRPPAAVGGRA